jgi:hypothetical protein
VDSIDWDANGLAIQVKAIRSHLQSIIEENHPPAENRIDRFFDNPLAKDFPTCQGGYSSHEIESMMMPELFRRMTAPSEDSSAVL